MSWSHYGFRPYVSVAERQRNAQRELAKLSKKGLKVSPVRIEGRTIARSFWGNAWCENLESYMDYANRLPRGRTYVRNGSVVHLEVTPGMIEAMVSGSELYKVKIQILAADASKWKRLCHTCAGGIGSLVELLQGRLSDQVMKIISASQTGLFPSPREIKMSCSCPDWAGMCKHLAAVLYGVGARLDEQPDLLFVLRSVNHQDLIQRAAAATELTSKAAAGEAELAESELGAVFGIEMDRRTAPAEPPPNNRRGTKRSKPAEAAAIQSPGKVPKAKRTPKTGSTGNKSSSVVGARQQVERRQRQPKRAKPTN